MLYGTLAVGNKQWNISISTDPWEQMQGLGGLAELPVGSGMLFDLGVEQAIQVTTVPMLFSLDIAFLSETLAITEVYRHVAPGYLVNSASPARYFLEVNAGELEGVEIGERAAVEIQSIQQEAATSGWMSVVMGLMGILVMGILASGIVKYLIRGLNEEPAAPKLLPQIRASGKFILKMDRPGNIIITHTERPCRSVFLQFEADKELVYDLLRKPERQDLEAGWPLEIMDTEPRASILDELWENASQPEKLPQTTRPEATPVAQLLEKWSQAKVRNSTLAMKDLATLGSSYDVEDCRQALQDYREIERSDYADPEDYQEARDEAWDEFIERLESLAGEEEEVAAKDKIEVVIVDRRPHHKLVKIYKKGRVYAATYAEPFPTRESALEDYRRNPKKFQPFDESSMTYLTKSCDKPAVIPVKSISKGTGVEYLADSPEFLTQTIDDIGYRNRIDHAFLEAIERARRGKQP